MMMTIMIIRALLRNDLVVGGPRLPAVHGPGAALILLLRGA